jgi:hypothetical protein
MQKIKQLYYRVMELIRNNEVVNKTLKNSGWLVGGLYPICRTHSS